MAVLSFTVGDPVLFAHHLRPATRSVPSSRRKTVFRLACLLMLVAVGSSSPGWTQPAATGEADSLAAWESIARVLRHPRCLNCHQLDSPLQGDERKRHIPPVVRGSDNLGEGTMKCRNCHNESGNNKMSGVPGASHWQLAPVSMLWEGLSIGELCRVLKNPALNGNRTPEALIEHMSADKLVLWGWEPGGRRAPVPVSHSDFVGLLKVWVAGGAVCPK